ncbi:MAG: DNA helicase [Spirochaetaceae bacterium]|nr:MAG: DNA helicase [Spirochaetaceae bacterium]
MPQPLIVQSDNTILLDVHDEHAPRARTAIAPFAELEKSPEHFHTYRVSPLSLWNAAAAGLTTEGILDSLRRYSRFPLPGNVESRIRDLISRYGRIRLEPTEDEYTLRLVVPDEDIREELRSRAAVNKYLREIPAEAGDSFLVSLVNRGTIKQELIRVGYPVEDRAPLVPGEPVTISLRETSRSGKPFHVRDYQREAAETFHGEGRPGAGYGTVVLPCGAGKTVVGMAVMNLLGTSTLILTTNIAAVHQWIDELLDKTELREEDIKEYSGSRKEIGPVTVATYQILVWRRDKDAVFPHFDIFRRRRWGLIIYDEVHLLPAPIFRVTAEIQSVRRLGLTATLVREDDRQEDVFTLVGPKRYDVPWKELEQKGWIAEAVCFEIRLDLARELRREYAVADRRAKFRIAAENVRKIEAAAQIVANHPEEPVIVIGQYLAQLDELAHRLDAPLITGRVPNARREEIYAGFRSGRIPVIVVSKVANFAIDLPDASVAVQVSGSFGSRQEEAQRLGRILRPKPERHRNSTFYSLVSNETVEETFAANRQKFLTEQGYAYHIEHWHD